jgi:anti-sigma-K factor RskA
MIDERMEEQASLHVLGALTKDEAREFKKAMQADPELKKLAARLSAAAGALAGTAPVAEPPPRLRANILAQIESRKPVSSSEQKFSLAYWLPWSFATGLAILCVMLFAQDSRLRHSLGDQARKNEDLNQLAVSLQSETDHLKQTVLALQETNRLASLKIAMLDSLLADAPKAIAVSLWDSEKQNGVLVAQHLKALPADKDYELWILDENKDPVAAGVFHIAEGGAIRLDFKPTRAIKAAGKFAVTEEVKGGVASPTLQSMVLASN